MDGSSDEGERGEVQVRVPPGWEPEGAMGRVKRVFMVGFWSVAILVVVVIVIVVVVVVMVGLLLWFWWWWWLWQKEVKLV